MNNNELTVVTYHYVRDVESTLWPGIKARGVGEFEAQVKWIKENYYLLDTKELKAVLGGRMRVPKRGAVLTFDDGYMDHYQTVMPILRKYEAWGVFFIAGMAVNENVVMDVNKIQFVAAAVDIHDLGVEIKAFVDEQQGEEGIKTWELYRQEYEKPGRFDGPEIVLVKKMLQFGLPNGNGFREQLVDDLFRKYVTKNEADFSKELYLDVNQIHEMWDEGMIIGNHTYSHKWLGKMSDAEQKEDIIKMDKLLNDWGVVDDLSLMCYPYGDSNEATWKIMKELKYDAAFSTVGEVADVRFGSIYSLPRLDTNQLPVWEIAGAISPGVS